MLRIQFIRIRNDIDVLFKKWMNYTGVCRVVNEEHARDLPIMNGIKEDIKSVGVNLGKSTHKEAFHSLSTRLKTLQVILLFFLGNI